MKRVLFLVFDINVFRVPKAIHGFSLPQLFLTVRTKRGLAPKKARLSIRYLDNVK